MTYISKCNYNIYYLQHNFYNIYNVRRIFVPEMLMVASGIKDDPCAKCHISIITV